MKKESFFKGAFIATAAIVISKILGILYVIPLADIIGQQGGALYGYAYNIYNLFLIISTAGIPLAISKLTSEYNTLKLDAEKTQMYKLAKKLIFGFSILSFLICFCFSNQIATLIIKNIEHGNTIKDVSFVIKTISFALLIVPFLSVSRGFLQGHTFITPSAISQVIEQVIRVIVIIGGGYLAYNIFNGHITYTVGVVLSGAFFGGIVAYLYLSIKMRQHKQLLNIDKQSSISNKEMIKKIILYALPFTLISIAINLYNSTDMILILKTLPKLGFSGQDTETIVSVITTWGIKFHMIISSVATGLMISLVPNIVSDYVKKDYNKVNLNFNNTLKILYLIIFPISIVLSLNANHVWNLFYGNLTNYGPLIIKYTLLISFLNCFYMLLNSLLQGLNKYKLVFTCIILGLGTNLILDIPLMHLFNYLNIPAYYGAILATAIGFIISILIPLISLKKDLKFDYNLSNNVLIKLLPATGLILLFYFLFKNSLFITYLSKGHSLMILIINSLVIGSIFLIFNYKHYKQIIFNILKK